MLKFVFWSLLCANGLLLAWGQGWLGTAHGGEREPARLRAQVAPARLTLITPEQAQAAASEGAAAKPEAEARPAADARPGSAAVAAPDTPETIACTAIGPFSSAEARRFEARLARLALPAKPERVSMPYQEVTSRLVYIAPLGSREAAERKAAELRAHGVTDFLIISNDSPLRWGISLGLFKADGAAQAMLASLAKQGVRGARILPRGPVVNRPAYQFRDLDKAQRARLAGIADELSDADTTDCR